MWSVSNLGPLFDSFVGSGEREIFDFPCFAFFFLGQDPCQVTALIDSRKFHAGEVSFDCWRVSSCVTSAGQLTGRLINKVYGT